MIRAADILDADARIRPYIRETPVVQSPDLSTATGATVFLKLEHQQHTGSFKLRGAFNRLLALTADERRRGVVAASSGNHGAAVAHAGAALSIPVTVYVPEGASPAKVGKIRALGATVVAFGTDGLDTELEARRAATAAGAVYVSPYNDEAVMAGQGTLAVELLRQAGPLDRVYVAVGGGGLIGGMATWIADVSPATRIVGALPAHSPVMAESVRAGRIVEMPSLPTLSDGTAGGIEDGSVTFHPCRTLVHEWVTVPEVEIADAMRRWSRTMDGPVEGAAGVAIAALLRDAGRIDGQRVAVVICGGNVSRDVWEHVTAGTS